MTAEYLLDYLQRSQFRVNNAGELARHAVQHLRAENYRLIEPLVNSLEHASVPQQLALAEGLALAAADKDHPLPRTVEAWMKRVLTTSARLQDAVLARRAIEAAEPIVFPEIEHVLRQLAVDTTIQQYPLRFIAVRALSTGPHNESVFEAVLNEGTASSMLRKLAVDALGERLADPRVVAALLKAMPSAPSDIALAIAIVLSKSEGSAESLLAEVAAGRVPARLLLHTYVQPGLAERSANIQKQVTTLTQELPSENDRLDAIIAARSMAYGRARPSVKRGGEVFVEQCASCHKLRDVGGSIGPSLDGLAARGVTRLMEDILDPSRSMDPLFRLTTLTVAGGETHTVMNLREQGDRYHMNDMTGQPMTLRKREVTAVAIQPTSLMPGIFETTLTDEDLYHLISFLISPSQK